MVRCTGTTTEDAFQNRSLRDESIQVCVTVWDFPPRRWERKSGPGLPEGIGACYMS